jgi:hypothetical protein
MLIEPRLVTRLLCVFTLAWFLSKFTFTLDDAITVSCTLSSLAFTFYMDGKQKNHEKSSHSESPVDAAMRKQIQYLNWMIIFNKALAFYQIQRNIYFKTKLQNRIKRCFSDDTHRKIKSNSMMKKWSSWSESIQIPDFHAQDCRNISTPPPPYFPPE